MAEPPPPQPGRRPVCYSLHKYFKTASQAPVLTDAVPDSSGGHQLVPFEARQAKPQPRLSWKRQEREEAQELQDAADSMNFSKPKEAANLQVVPAATPRKNRGGRPKKAAGTGTNPYKTLTGPQRVWTVLRCKELL